ncbi:MAG: sulfurtransferase-like selenium metabolism protein YedF [Candidatus Eisenbacteria bacterium]|nr:sulfurtransferase-like selenium metabolism protein YedF [Candidatus Eisenbacteria bacterium]
MTESPAIDPGSPGHVLLFTSDRLGDGPEELGRVLIRSFLKVQKELAPLPWRMLILNSAIHLTIQGSPVAEDLRELEAAGVEVLSCGTCLDFFRAKDRLVAGRVSNMREISESLLRASRVVRP